MLPPLRAALRALVAASLALALLPARAPAAGMRLITVTVRSPEARAEFERGRAFADNVRMAEAAQHLEAALKLEPGFRLARAWLGKVTPGAAGLELLAEAAADDVPLPEAERTAIAHMLARRRDDPQALPLARKLTELAPDDWRAFEILAEYQFALGDMAGLVASARHAAELNPTAGTAWNELGYGLARLGDAPEAMEAFKHFAQLEPGEPNARDSLGEALLALGRLDQAESAFSKATQLDPHFYSGYEGEAYCRFYRGDFAGGRKAVERAIVAAVRAEDRLDEERLRAWSWFAEGDAPAALDALAPLEKSPLRSWQAAQDRGAIFIETGRAAEGIAQLQLAQARAQQSGLSGDLRSDLEREGLSLRLLAETTGKGTLKDAQKTADRIAELAKGSANTAWKSTALLAKGLLLAANGNARAAAEALAACGSEDTLCRRELLRAQEKAGLREAAAATRAALLREGRRTPLGLYLRARLQREAAAAPATK